VIVVTPTVQPATPVTIAADGYQNPNVLRGVRQPENAGKTGGDRPADGRASTQEAGACGGARRSCPAAVPPPKATRRSGAAAKADAAAPGFA
jgi:hypothetical protein